VTIMMKNSLYSLLRAVNPAKYDFAAFSLAKMNRINTWKH
jgi:hypothetical protein